MTRFIGELSGKAFNKGLIATKKVAENPAGKFLQSVDDVSKQADEVIKKASSQIRHNFIAGQQARRFHLASPEDLKILTSDETKHIMRRARFIHPETGQTMYVVKHNILESPDKLKFRLLDSQGKLIKETVIDRSKLSKTVFIDDFSNCPTMKFFTDSANELTHGKAVHQFATKNNPFSEYELINVAKGEDPDLLRLFSGEGRGITDLENAFESLFKRICNGERIDNISVSIGNEVPIPILGDALNLRLNANNLLQNKKLIREKLNHIKETSVDEIFERLTKNGTFGRYEKEFGGTFTAEEKLAIAKKTKSQLEDVLEGICSIEKVTKINSEKLVKPPLLDEITVFVPKVKFAAGNGGKDSVNMYLFADGVEGVGSLNAVGKRSKFSASGNLAGQYQTGEYRTKITDKGLNYTKTSGTDLTFNEVANSSFYKKYVGKPISDFLVKPDELELIKQSENPIRTAISKFRGRIIKAEELAKIYPDEVLKEELLKHKDMFVTVGTNKLFQVNKQGIIMPSLDVRGQKICGTSFSTPVETAKSSLVNWLKSIELI